MASLIGAVTALTPRGTPGLVSWEEITTFPRTYTEDFTEFGPGGRPQQPYGAFTKAVATLAALTASDTATLTATEDPFDENEIATTDTARLSASDVSLLFNRIDTTDTATLTAGETIALLQGGVTLKTASDTASLSASESVALDVTLDVTDTATLTVTDTASVDVSEESVDVTDTANLSADDTYLLEIFAGIVEKSVLEDALLTVFESTSVLEVRRVRTITFDVRMPRMTLEIL